MSAGRLAELLAIMRDETLPHGERTAAAIEALPMMHKVPAPIAMAAADHLAAFTAAELRRD